MKNFFLSGRLFLTLSILPLVLPVLSCGGQPKVAKGSAEYQFLEAKKAISDVKFEKAISLTSDILSRFPSTEYGDKARILRIVLLSGLSQGHGKLAEAHLAGFEKSIKNAGALRSVAFDFYRKQKIEALGFFEACDFFLKNYSEKTPYVLDVEYPHKDFTPNRKLDEVRSGTVLTPEELKTAEEDELRNGLIMSLTGFLGAGDDRAKARKLLESGPRPLDHAEFMVMLGRTLLENQKVFGRRALNEIQNYRQFYEKSSECSELALKLLKDNPNQEIQSQADQLKTELEVMKKERTQTTSS
jgi:hypothetical protein